MEEETIDPKKKKSVATSYDNSFENIKKTTPEQARKNVENIENIHGSGIIRESFNTSKNKDYLKGWENPHTIYGGIGDTNSNDPFSELRANNQSSLNKFSKIPARISTKIISEVAKIPGYVGGLGGGLYGEASDAITGKNEYSFTEQAFNNGWIKGITELNEKVNNEALPVYVKKAVKEGNLWDNISSVDFWATEGADGIGFMASMMVPGAILKSLGLGSKLARTSEVALSLGSKGTKFQKLMQGAQKASNLGLTVENFDMIAATTANTYLEAAAESGMAMDSFEKENKNEFIDNALASGKTIEQAEQEFNTQKAILGKNIFVSNVALLTIPNAIQSSIMFGKGASKFMSKYGAKEFLKNSGKRMAGSTLSEGFVEEASQTTVENYFKEKAKKNNLKGDGLFSFEDFDPKGLKDAYLDTISSVDGQKAIFLGGLLGSSMSIYQGRKEDVRNKKQSDEAVSLTQRYDQTLQALLDTKGNVSYNYNNQRSVSKKEIIEKFRTIDALSNRFDEYDEALASGNEEILEKVRNKTIQDVILPFVKSGEIGIDALTQYYDKMLESDEVKNSEEFDVIKARKEEVIKTAQDVSKKYDFYTNFINKRFNIPIKAANKEEQKTLDLLKAQYFDKLSSSYALAEMEKEQVQNKLKSVNKELDELNKIHGLNEVTTDELINEYVHNTDTTESFTNKKKEKFSSKNESYKKLLDYKNKLEEKLKETNIEISENYFDNKKINNDFLLKEEDNVENNLEIDDVLDDEIPPDELMATFSSPSSPAVVTPPTKASTTTVPIPESSTTISTSSTKPVVKKKKVKKVEDPRIKELNKKIFLLENLNKEVVLNGNIKGTLIKINDERYEVHSGNIIHEININDITSFKAEGLNGKYNVENITEDSVTVNGVDYIINTDSKGNIISLSPTNKPSQEIKNEKLITAVEIKRNQLEYREEVENIEEVIDKLENNYSNLNALLDTIWETNMTNTVAEALDNLYEDKPLTKSQQLQLSLWLTDAFKRVVRLYSDKNTKEETDVLNQAYSNLEIIEALLYDLNINNDEKSKQENSNTKNEITVAPKKDKRKTTKVNNQELEDLKKQKDDILQEIKEENSVFKTPEINEDAQIDEIIQANEVAQVEKELQSAINESLDETGTPTFSQEDLGEFLKEQDIPEEVKDAIVLLNEEQINTLPTQEEVEDKSDFKLSELEGINEEDLAKDDFIRKEEDDYILNSFTNIEVITPKENNTLGHKIQNFFSDIFKKFEKEPRDKTKDDVVFSLGDLKYITGQPTILAIFTKLKNGKELISSEIEFLKQHQEWLENYLPIQVTLNNGKEKASSFLKAKTNNVAENDIFVKNELPLRKAIIKALIDNKGDFTKFKGSVQGQGKGKLNLDNNSTNNNVLKLSVFNGMTNDQKINYIKENSYIVNHSKQLVHTKTGQIAVDSFFNVIKSFHSGDLFLVVTRPNGERVPIKLNNKRITRDKAKSTVQLFALLSKTIKNNEGENVLNDNQFNKFIEDNIGKKAFDTLSSEIKLSSKANNITRLREIIEYITFSQNNNPITKLFIDNSGNLTLGSLIQKINEDLQENGSIGYEMNLSSIGFIGFQNNNIDALINDESELDTNELARLNHLVNFIMYKKTNIKADKLNDDNYIKHVFDISNNNNESGNALVSTNVAINQDMFEGYSNIYLNNDVINLEDNKTVSKEEKEIDNTEIPLSNEIVYNEPQSDIESKLGHKNNIQLFKNFVNILQEFKKQFPNEAKLISENANTLKAFIVGGTTDINRNGEARGDLDIVFLHQNEVDNSQINEFGAAIQKLQYFITDMGNNTQQPAIESNLRPSEKSSPIDISSIISKELKTLEETKNNSENFRIIQENIVSLSNIDNITSLKDKVKIIKFAKDNLDFKPKSTNALEQFEQLKKEFDPEKLNEVVNKVCNI
jgi:hypothetical protein